MSASEVAKWALVGWLATGLLISAYTYGKAGRKGAQSVINVLIGGLWIVVVVLFWRT